MPMKINEAWAAQRRAQLAAIEQMAQADRLRREEQQAKAAAFAQQAQAHHEAWERGEMKAAELPELGETLGQAFRASDAARAPYERGLRREIDGSPEHRRMVEDMTMPVPGVHRQWVKEHINDSVEPSPAEAWAHLQDARKGVDLANKQLTAVKGRQLSPEELAYATKQVETARASEAAALARFNVLTDVPVPPPPRLSPIEQILRNASAGR